MEHSVHSYAFDDPAKNQKRTLAFVLRRGDPCRCSSGCSLPGSAQVVEVMAPPVETEIIDEEIQGRRTAAAAAARIEPPPPFVPPPEVSDRAAGGDRTDDRDHDDHRTTRPSRPPPKPARRAGQDAAVDAGQGCAHHATRISRRRRDAPVKQGTVNLQVYVLENGRARRDQDRRSRAASRSSTKPPSRKCSATGVSSRARKTASRCPMWHSSRSSSVLTD